jgi:AcrR family transcriptional regulator
LKGLETLAGDETPAEQVEELDGRRRRSLDSRARIVAAMLDLVREGDVSPGAETVASRAEVGLRTVFRHFKDMDSLYGEMSHAIEAEVRKGIAQPFRAAGPRERVIELVERRAGVYEKIAPFRRASDARRHTSDFLAASLVQFRTEARAILVALLPADVAADPVKLEALDLLLSFEAWNRLRVDQGLSQSKTREVLSAAVTRMLDA